MAATIILFDRNTEVGRRRVRALSLIREGFELLAADRLVNLQYRDGDGSSASHYDLFAVAGGYTAGDYADANTAAKASFDEVDSLHAKLSTNSSVTDVNAAIYQACAKHGI